MTQENKKAIIRFILAFSAGFIGYLITNSSWFEEFWANSWIRNLLFGWNN